MRRSVLFYFQSPSATLVAAKGFPMLIDPHPCQQHAGLRFAVFQLSQDVTLFFTSVNKIYMDNFQKHMVIFFEKKFGQFL